MTITVNGEKKEVNEGLSLRQALITFTPYGEEATIIIRNGEYIKSIDLNSDDVVVEEGDNIDKVPLIIGG